MKNKLLYILPILFLTGYFSCKKPFNAQLATVATNYLAVDGPIISGDTTFITLSRTTSLSDTTQLKAELKAIIAVEDDQAQLYNLTEMGKGKYFLPTTNFNTARKYRLDIKTKDGKIYQSDFVQMKATGPIDSLYFTVTDKSVQFYLDAHDPTNNTRYYRWDYKNVWQYTSYYEANYKYISGQIVNINDANFLQNDTYYCYRHDFSNQIFVGTSANQSQDVIKKQLLASLADTSQKISEIYAMVVNQYALTADGYKYYQELKTNTENLGSIFDPQPSFVTGNIHCITSPSDLVLGFVSASTVSHKILIFHYNDLGVFKITPGTNGTRLNSNNSFYYGPDSLKCLPGRLLFAPATTYALRTTRALASGDSLVYGQYIVVPGPGWIGYLYAPKQCVDCSYQGGTKTRPSYFPPPY